MLVLLGASVIVGNTVRSAPLAVDLSGSAKQADVSEVGMGGTIQYTLVVSNSGDSTATGIKVTDTLQTGLTYVADSLTVPSTGGVISEGSGASGGVVTWTGTIQNAVQQTIQFDVTVGDPITVGQAITNAFVIDYAGSLITKTVVVTVTAEPPTKTIYFPAIFKTLTAPVLEATGIALAGSNYQWTTGWNAVAGASNYTIQASTDPNFGTILSEETVSILHHIFLQPGADDTYYYYYRVRANSNTFGIGSGWSNVVTVVKPYYDDFSSGVSKWVTRRQDRDDVQNEIHHDSNNYLKMWVRGRWDFMLASPLDKAPPPPYRIETRVKFDGVGNLNTYGIIWGGDWNGGVCPRAGRSAEANRIPETMIAPTSDVYYRISGRAPLNYDDNCFQTYYRTIMLWQGPGNEMKFQVKRVDYHDDNNHGKGVDLRAWNNIQLQSGDSLGWNTWTIDVYENGTVNIFSGTNLVAQVNDTRYLNQPYFGLFASTDEYPGSDPLWDYIKVEPRP